jgi:hypothetical protein
MWRDELQAWLISLGTKLPSDLIANTRYEGRPPLWHFLLWILSRSTNNPEYIKIIVFLLAATVAIILLFFLNIPTYLSILIISSFLFTGGYTTISRDYILLLTLLTILIYLKNKQYSTNTLLILVAILALVNLFALIISIAFLSAIVYSEVKNSKKNKFTIYGALSYLLAFSVILLSVLLITPPEDNQFKPSPNFNFFNNLNVYVEKISSTFLPFQIDTHSKIIFVIVSIFLIVIILYLFNIDTFAFIFVAISFILMSLNYVYGYAYYWWHFGTLFIVILYGLILTFNQNNKNLNYGYILAILLVLPYILANFYGPGKEIFSSRPYSNAKNVAMYLQQNCTKDCEIIVNLDYAGTSVSAYLGGAPIYFANSEQFGTYVIWDKNRILDFSWEKTLKATEQFKDPFILIVGLDNPPDSVYELERFGNAIWSDEDYIIYKLKQSGEY